MFSLFCCSIWSKDVECKEKSHEVRLRFHIHAMYRVSPPPPSGEISSVLQSAAENILYCSHTAHSVSGFGRRSSSLITQPYPSPQHTSLLLLKKSYKLANNTKIFQEAFLAVLHRGGITSRIYP